MITHIKICLECKKVTYKRKIYMQEKKLNCFKEKRYKIKLLYFKIESVQNDFKTLVTQGAINFWNGWKWRKKLKKETWEMEKEIEKRRLKNDGFVLYINFWNRW